MKYSLYLIKRWKIRCGYKKSAVTPRFFVSLLYTKRYINKKEKYASYYLYLNNIYYMARIQKYGIKYPFENKNIDNVYIDLNENTKDELKSQVLHVLFTPKGQRMRDPNFGTDLTKFLFDQTDSVTDDNIIKSISRDLKAYVPSVNLEKIVINKDENDDKNRILIIHYSVSNGNKVEHTTAAVKI